MKKIITSLLTLLFATSAFAQTALVVNRKSGGSIYYSFESRPIASFEGTDLVLSTDSASVIYPLDNLQSFTFDDMANGIYDIKASDGAKVKLNRNTAAVSGLADGTQVSVYSISGMAVKSVRSQNGVALIPIDDLPAGTYVIRSGSLSYKIMKK